MESVARGPRVRRSVRRVAIVAFFVLLPIAAYSAWDYIETRRLVRELKAIRDRGEPLGSLDLRPSAPVTPEEHAASRYQGDFSLGRLDRPDGPPSMARVHDVGVRVLLRP